MCPGRPPTQQTDSNRAYTPHDHSCPDLRGHINIFRWLDQDTTRNDTPGVLQGLRRPSYRRAELFGPPGHSQGEPYCLW
jgi:hypothetical protein